MSSPSDPDYRDTRQQQIDAHHRRTVVGSAAGHALGHGGQAREVFFDLVEELGLWTDVLAILGKRHWPDDHRIELVEAERARRESGQTSVTEQ